MLKVKQLLQKCLSYLTTGGRETAMDTTAKVISSPLSREVMLSKSREEAIAHWKYVEATLKAHDVNSAIAQYHYISAFMHGYGHGAEDQATGRVSWHLK